MPRALPPTVNPVATPAWSALTGLARNPQATDLQALFRGDPLRFENWSCEAGNLLLDFSKQRWNTKVLGELLRLAEAMHVPAWIEALFSGAAVNNTEQRAAMHWALRLPETSLSSGVDPDLAAQILSARRRTYALAQELHGQRWRGATGKPLRWIVNLGIGGSDLGPRLVCDALSASGGMGVQTSFVANVDAAELCRVLARVVPEETLFVVTSKTFTTQETLRNAISAKSWLHARLGEQAKLGAHFLAVTANTRAALAFGIDEAHILPMWDWVGGRFSVWSAVGFPVVAQVGPDVFDEFLQGAHELDRHLRDTSLDRNAPVLMAMLGVWNRNFLGYPDLVAVPYARGLELLTPYLQQLEMESNGKSVRRDGECLEYPACPALWGTVGTSGQHAYFQWLHQGSGAPVDFVLAARGESDLAEHQEILLANALAQAQAFLQGKSQADALAEQSGVPELARHRRFAGGRPSTTILMPRVDARRLGQILALYEHKTFMQGVLWGINSFDQWGVELGKSLAAPLLAALREGTEPPSLDGSTRGLLRAILRLRAGR